MRSIVVARRVIRQLFKDKRTLGLLIFAPLFVVFLMYTILGSTIDSPKIQAVGLPDAMLSAFEEETSVTSVVDKDAALDDLKYKKTDAVVVYSDPDVFVYVEGSDPSVTAAVKKSVGSAMSAYIKTYVQDTAQKKAEEQKQSVREKIDAQIATIQADVTGKIEEQKAAIQDDMESQMEQKVEDMKSNIKSKISSQMKKALKSKIKAAISSASEQQRAALQEQLTAYQTGVMQTIAQSIQGYNTTVQQAVQSYLESAGAAGVPEPFQAPAFTMPEIPPPVINIPSISVSVDMPSVDLSGIEMPTLNMPDIAVPEISANDIEVPDISISVDVSEINYTYLNGSDDMTSFDAVAPYMMGFFVFFFVFIIAGVSFLRERISGTLDRVLATPIRRYQIVFGYFIGFGVFVFIQTVLIQLFMVYALNVVIKGSFMLVLVINLLLATGSLALGTLLSAFARNEMQMFQFIPVVILPQVLFCGIFSLREAPIWVQALSRIFPLTYGAQALSDIAIRGLGFSDIALNLGVLAAFTILFLLLNTLVLKKYRRL